MKFFTVSVLLLKQDDVGDKIKQTLLYIFVFICFVKACKIVLHLSLGRYSHFQFIVALLVSNDKFSFYPVGVRTKCLTKNFIIDKWFTITIVIKPDPFFTKLFYINRNGRNKIPHDTFDSLHGNTPDAKETEDMIDSKCIEIIAHLLKSLPPPRKTILLHPFPIVSGKAPVLSFNSKT